MVSITCTEFANTQASGQGITIEGVSNYLVSSHVLINEYICSIPAEFISYHGQSHVSFDLAALYRNKQLDSLHNGYTLTYSAFVREVGIRVNFSWTKLGHAWYCVTTLVGEPFVKADTEMVKPE